MVKTLNVVFDDEEFDSLSEKKKELGLDWRKFILTLLNHEEPVES